MTTIERLGAYLPPTTRSVAEVGAELGLTRNQVTFFTRYLGLDRIAVAPDADLVDLLVAAGADALGDTDRDQVRVLIHTHTMQHVATRSRRPLDDVRAALGLRRAVAFGMSHQNCVAGLSVLKTARTLLATEAPGARALILSGDKIVAASQRIIPGSTILGEASSAAVLGPGPQGDRVVGEALLSLGRFYRCLDWPEDQRLEYKHLYNESVVQVMRLALDRAGRQPDDIAVVLPHNVNRLTWKAIAREVGIPADRILLDNVRRLGHCYTADSVLNLATAHARGLVRPGDPVLLVMAGLGAAFAATVVECGRVGAGPAIDALAEDPAA